MDTPLDEIRFLADSEHRVVVLDTLADAPTSRADLRDVTGASSATIGRILGDFDDRGWVRRDGDRYELTRLGAFVAEKFERLHDSMSTARDLQPLLAWLPLDEMGVGIDNLVGARVTVRTDPIEFTSRLRTIELDGTHVRSFSAFFPEACVDARYQAVVNGSQTYEVVFAAGFDREISTASAEKFEALLGHDRTTMYLNEESEMPMLAFIDDDGVCLLVRDDEGTTVALVETDDEAVVDYVEATFEAYREQSTPLTVEQFSVERTCVTEA